MSIFIKLDDSIQPLCTRTTLIFDNTSLHWFHRRKHWRLSRYRISSTCFPQNDLGCMTHNDLQNPIFSLRYYNWFLALFTFILIDSNMLNHWLQPITRCFVVNARISYPFVYVDVSWNVINPFKTCIQHLEDNGPKRIFGWKTVCF